MQIAFAFLTLLHGIGRSGLNCWHNVSTNAHMRIYYVREMSQGHWNKMGLQRKHTAVCLCWFLTVVTRPSPLLNGDAREL